MSRRLSPRDLHDQHQDIRNEVRRLERHEADVRERQSAIWRGRMAALQNTDGREAEDWGEGFWD